DGVPCYGSGLVQVCATQMPVMMFEVTADQTLDTDSQCDSGVVVNQTNVCVKIAKMIKITHTLHATGSHPPVLVGTHTVRVGMELDVSSTAAGQIGAGALPVGGACGTNQTPGTGGGGPGGSFSGIAGPGGNGTTTAAGTQPRPTLLRGGCPGSSGDGATNGG